MPAPAKRGRKAQIRRYRVEGMIPMAVFHDMDRYDGHTYTHCTFGPVDDHLPVGPNGGYVRWLEFDARDCTVDRWKSWGFKVTCAEVA